MTEQPAPSLSDLLDRLDERSRRAGETEVSSEGPNGPTLVLGKGSVTEAGIDATTSRRSFLAQASALSLMIPGVGGALAACSQGGPPARSDTTRKATSAANAAGASTQPHNSDSRLDSSVVGGQQGAAATAAAASGPAFHRFDPTLPPANTTGRLQLSWHAREAPIRITDDTVVSAWTFEGDIPGPIVHCRVGDTVEFTLTNDVDVPHSMDMHAAQIDPKQAFRSVGKGQSVTYTFKPKYAGAFMYHCGTAPVLMHIGSGMHGAIIVSPREGLAPAKEFVLVESEFYLGEAANGVRPFDYNKMLSTLPDYVAFNGRPSQYVKEPIRVKVGDRVRFWIVDVGPTHPCAFHVVGDQFDTVYLGAPPGTPLHGVQTFSVPAGGGMVFELMCDIPGEFPFVNHAFGHGQKGSIGILVVEQ
jgi:nitrite reductase (NO-forming)